MSLENSERILVTGATSLVGKYLLPQLVKAGFTVCALTRDLPPYASGSSGIVWERRNIAMVSELQSLTPVSIVIHLAPLWLLPPLIKIFADKGVRRLIAFGSTSRFTKVNSSHVHEQQLVKKLIHAEQLLEEECRKNDIQWTLFRPTLIYDTDESHEKLIGGLRHVAKFIRFTGHFLTVGEASGFRQPVHAEDLAHACIQSLYAEKSYDKAYNLSGGNVISYREMISHIFMLLEKTPRFIAVPQLLIYMMVKFINLLPAYRYITVEMLNRMNKDMNFDHQSAREDFAYSPRRFLQ